MMSAWLCANKLGYQGAASCAGNVHVDWNQVQKLAVLLDRDEKDGAAGNCQWALRCVDGQVRRAYWPSIYWVGGQALEGS